MKEITSLDIALQFQEDREVDDGSEIEDVAAAVFHVAADMPKVWDSPHTFQCHILERYRARMQLLAFQQQHHCNPGAAVFTPAAT